MIHMSPRIHGGNLEKRNYYLQQHFTLEEYTALPLCPFYLHLDLCLATVLHLPEVTSSITSLACHSPGRCTMTFKGMHSSFYLYEPILTSCGCWQGQETSSSDFPWDCPLSVGLRILGIFLCWQLGKSA